MHESSIEHFTTIIIVSSLTAKDRPVYAVLTPSVREVWDSIFDTVSSTARHRCDLSFEQRCPRANKRGELEMGPTARYTLRRNPASAMKV